jgi:hypothetical protein
LINDRLTCFGTIVKKNIDEKNSVTLEISMKVLNQDKEKRILGTATINLKGES